jgi:hypothetical protein
LQTPLPLGSNSNQRLKVPRPIRKQANHSIEYTEAAAGRMPSRALPRWSALGEAAQNYGPAERAALMVHETAHVWQFIHGGGDYKLDSIWYQSHAGAGAYYWWLAVDAGYPWSFMTPEQQAKFVEDAYAAKCYDFTGTRVLRGVDRYSYFLTVDDAIINGNGAP